MVSANVAGPGNEGEDAVREREHLVALVSLELSPSGNTC
jgi:hypothetical protein